MANNPNDSDPKRPRPNDPNAKRPDDGTPFEELPDLSEYEIALPGDPLSGDGLSDTVPTDGPQSALLEDAVSFDAPVPTGDPASFTIGVSLEDLANLPDIPGLSGAGLSGKIPTADPASGDMTIPEATPGSSARIGRPEPPGEDREAAIGNLDSVAPVAPVSGWLDSDHDEPIPPAAHLGVHEADLFEAPPRAVESSDIFGSGPLPKAKSIDQSDVIASTAYGAATPADSAKSGDRPSDVALSFDQPPGGSTLQGSSSGSGNLPMAEELAEAEEVPDSALFGDVPAALPFDSSKLPRVKPNDVPDFGATPQSTPDASSILADLSEPGTPSVGDSSSAVRLEAPGIGRTLSSDHGEGTEFDLTVDDDGAIPPELAEAEAAAGGDPADRSGSGSGLFSSRASTEVDLDIESSSIHPLLDEDASPSTTPSSIFSNKPKSPASSGRLDQSAEVPIAEIPTRGGPGSSDSSVEFSDQPQAEDEAAASKIFGAPSPPRLDTPASPPLRKSTPSMGEFELPEEAPAAADADDGGMIDWNAASAPDDEATIGVPRDMIDSPPSGILSRGKPAKPAEEPAPAPAAKSKPAPAKPTKGKKTETPSDSSVEIDWMAGSSTEEPAVAEDAPSPASRGKEKGKDKGKAKPGRDEELQNRAMSGRRGGGGLLTGAFVGVVLAGSAVAGAYFADAISFGEKTTQTPPPGGGGKPPLPPPPGGIQTPGEPTATDVAAAVRAGDAAKAKQLAALIKDTTATGKAAVGEAQLFALVQENDTVAADNADLKTARENLQAVVDDPMADEKAAVKAAIQLGLSHQIAGDRAAARKVYEGALQKFPKYASTFEAAIDRLDATGPPAAPPPPPEGTSRRIDPADAQQLLLALILLQDPPAKDDDTEAGVYFWKAVKLAGGEKYSEAIDMIGKAKAAHVKQAKAKAGQGLNPLSDPLEQIFPRSCDDLKAYWELRAAIYTNKAFADLFKKDGAAKALAELQRRADSAVTLMADLKNTEGKLAKAETDLKGAEKAVKDAMNKLDDQKTQFAKAEEAAKKELTAVKDEAAKLDRERQKADTLVTSLAKELQAAKLLGPKYDAAELLAAQKRATDRATGPNLTTLLPTGMVAIGGGGLSSAQLIDTAERLAKAETAAKIATDRLTTETKRLTDAHAVEMKKLADGYAADLKKVIDTNATNVSKLKDDQAVELKKMSDKYVADAKKLTDGFEGKIKALEVAVTAEKARTEAQAAQFKKELGDAIGPAQALDLWLPVLVELRRPSDSDAAIATATKVITSAPADSEDAGKARTVAGLALLYKGEMPMAKAMFQAARSNPTHQPALAAKKLWAIAADVGLQSVDDPLAAYRLPPELPKRNPIAAARFLDTGVKAYRNGLYSEAVAALTDSTKADPTDPVAWYFLGAARWASGSTDAAKDAFTQGALREKATDMPTRLINAALSPIQGPTRDALSASRP